MEDGCKIIVFYHILNFFESLHEPFKIDFKEILKNDGYLVKILNFSPWEREKSLFSFQSMISLMVTLY